MIVGNYLNTTYVKLLWHLNMASMEFIFMDYCNFSTDMVSDL